MFKRFVTCVSLCGLYGLGGLPSTALAHGSHAQADPDPAHQHETTSHAPHVHGRATMQMLVDADKILVETQIPADTLFGFAHAPKTPEQHAVMEKRHADLTTTGARFSKAAECRLTQAQWENPLKENKDAHHDHHHADIHITWHYQCQSPAQLKDAEFSSLFQAWPRLEQIELEWLMPAQPANARQITSEHAHVNLTP